MSIDPLAVLHAAEKGVRRLWQATLAQGIIAILFGLCALIFTQGTARVLILILGIYAAVVGIGLVVDAFRQTERSRVWMILNGAINIAVAVMAFFFPDVTGRVLVILVGIWAVAVGVLQVVAALRVRRAQLPGWTWQLVTGLLWLALGVLMLVNPFSFGVVAIMWTLGLFAIAIGVFCAIFALVIRQHAKQFEVLTQQATKA